MNIKEAKQEIIHTLRAYFQKDETGAYTYPLVRQRPILLMGPPGVGKTAIMEQIAEACGVGLVAYTMTHHTRQSAIGLPHIETAAYDGISMEVTRYTLSEIIASIYDCMARSGKKEGILFLDEINCVSETLAPTMLQFLQNKTFGSHRLPQGWMIVAAGNPRRYNKSAREFDVVTLDRVRWIETEADCDVWMEYAWDHQVHEAILSYLAIKKENFYLVEHTADGSRFVTARGWEDLSEILKSYEALEAPVGAELVAQYLQKEEIARDFAAYYQLYRKYGTDYAIPVLLEGRGTPEYWTEKISMARRGSFEERFTVVHLVLGYMGGSFSDYVRTDSAVAALHQALQVYREMGGSLGDFTKSRRHSLAVKCQAELLTPAARTTEAWVLQKLEEYELALREARVQCFEDGFGRIRTYFQEETARRGDLIRKIDTQLANGFRFLEDAFGEGQEMALFLSSLTRSAQAMEYISRHGCGGFLKHSRLLLYRQREQELRQACLEL